MKRILSLVVLGTALCAATGSSIGATPDLEVAQGSYITLGVAGAQRTIDPQVIATIPAWEPGSTLSTTGAMTLPRVGLAFGEYVDFYPNQTMRIAIDEATGEGSLEFPVWLVDSDGNRLELPVSLSTDTPTTRDCSNFPLCLGIPGDPAYCEGQAWDSQTGEVRFVGVSLVPFQSGTTVDCSPVVVVLEAVLGSGDADSDGVKDLFDGCPDVPDPSAVDVDSDGRGDLCDNCVSGFNPLQLDADGDGTGTACEPVQVNFQPSAAPVPAGFGKDSGGAFGIHGPWGWDGTGVTTLDREMLADQLLDTLASPPSTDRWEAALPPGDYDVIASVGDPAMAGGPHVVDIELASSNVIESTSAGEFVEISSDETPVADGRLTLDIGDPGGATTINYVVATESEIQPFFRRHIDFGPGGSPLPAGFERDASLGFDPGLGFGWAPGLPGNTVARWALGDDVLDTYVWSHWERSWELELPPDFYLVTIGAGDSRWGQGPMRLVVEGEVWMDDVYTADRELVTYEGIVLVMDGRLTLQAGGATNDMGTTSLTHISVRSLDRDVDGDGVPNLNDNCLEEYNPDQADTDGDGEGDVCAVDSDGDGWSDPTDNCPDDFNPAQDDSDTDAWGDACDCAPQDGTVFVLPPEVEFLILGEDAGGTTLLGWSDLQPLSGSGTRYDAVSGSLNSLTGTFSSAGCLFDDRAEHTLQDSRIPAPGDGYYYLVRGDNSCGEGSYGVSLSPERAVLDASGPCP